MKLTPTSLLRSFLGATCIAILLSGCATSSPEIEQIPDTVIVDRLVTVEVTSRSEPVTIEVTRLVVITADASVDENLTLGTTAPTPQGTASSPRLFLTYPSGTRTDLDEVDYILEYVESRDRIQLRNALLFTSWPCVETGSPGAPLCNVDEPPGTMIDVFSFSSCEGFLTRDEETIESVIDELFAQASGLHAVIGSIEMDLFGVLFADTSGQNKLAIILEGDKIADIRFGCGDQLSEVLPYGIVGEPILNPPEE